MLLGTSNAAREFRPDSLPAMRRRQDRDNTPAGEDMRNILARQGIGKLIS